MQREPMKSGSNAPYRPIQLGRSLNNVEAFNQPPCPRPLRDDDAENGGALDEFGRMLYFSRVARFWISSMIIVPMRSAPCA